MKNDGFFVVRFFADSDSGCFNRRRRSVLAASRYTREVSLACGQDQLISAQGQWSVQQGNPLLKGLSFFICSSGCPDIDYRNRYSGRICRNIGSQRKNHYVRRRTMNRENKRRKYEKGYYKTHPCTDSFTCKVCGRPVVSAGAGSSHRNHCPNCLSSLHVDIEPGDRESDCGGIMEPVAVWVRKNGEWAIIHRCRRCGALSSNRVAADDNPMKLMSIAMKPVCLPPFPLERIEEMTKLMAGDGSLKF